ncbi:MAG: AAA family ATPase [Spirochaetota bacterium]|nr:AAA family ATPase [Spirochaetota bacterium]
MKKKRIPYAVSNLEQIRSDNYYFVDKTEYLEKLENYITPVFLRPRRFGKTLLCSIQECYYDINRKDKFTELFGDTYIGKNPTPEQGKYMVLRLNFSSIQVTSKESEIEYNFNYINGLSFRTFVSYYKEILKGFSYEQTNIFTNKLANLIQFIKENNLPQIYLIIDEYDNFTNQLITSNNDILYKNLTSDNSFLKTFFKKLKEGTESQAIKRVFITGVLPITIDDLSSGFNIAQIITLKKPFISMLGFTQKEVDIYLENVFNDYQFDKELTAPVSRIIKNYYNGYQFAEGSEPLYNSTIISYFLSEFIINEGEIPTFFIDTNLKTDISWIRRLTLKESNTKEMLETIILNNELEYDSVQLTEKFNMNQFFQPDFYPVSLFYLGMLTIKDSYSMKIPNQTMQAIFTEYFNEVENFNVSYKYSEIFKQFLKDMDLKKLFRGYWDVYISQFPAQMFDKANENFFRSTFYELCRRHLSQHFAFEIEINRHSGRADWELLGKPASPYKNIKYLAEFKHFTAKDIKIFKGLTEARPEDIKQIKQYGDEIKDEFPYYTITNWLIYTFSGRDWKVFKN